MFRKILLPIACIAALALNHADAQTKRALLIGVANYPDPRWKPLSSATDLNYMQEALQLQGFAKENMTLLADEQATKSGISQAFESLTKNIQAGDIVYIHFSGHGQQIEDDKENQDEVDGYDEAIVPYDARGKYDPVKYQGQNHFRDDLMGQYLNGIRSAVGANGSVLVVIDACHSGTATRSAEFATVRGDPTPFASPEYKPVLTTGLSRLSNVQEGFMSDGPLKVSNMVVFSASSPNQVNYETKDATGTGVGSLTYALARALQRMEPNSNYGELFAAVKAMIQSDYPQQLPMMEGDANQQVFSGNFLAKEDQQKIDRWLSDTSFIVSMGQLQGIYAGTELNILNASNRSLLGTAIISESNPVSCVGNTSKPFDKAQPYLVTVKSYGTPPVLLGMKVVANKGVNEKQKALIEEWVKTLPGVQLSDNADYMLALANVNGQCNMELVETGDAIRWKGAEANGKKPSDETTKSITAALQQGARSRFLRSMPDGGPLAGQIELVIEAQAEKDASNEWKLNRGMPYKFTIINNSPVRVYYNLLNILPTNETSVLLPAPPESPQNYSIGPGQRIVEDGIMVEVNAALGKEWLKIICSVRPIDLRPVFATEKKGTQTRGVGGVFEQWLNESLEHTNTVRTRSAGPDAVTVVSAGFTVVEKK
ncbi:MAG TPA: caspase family protein [Phnomibacter sp.]|nr:caspase family protein [Phnomibacter sp.]